MPGPISNSVNFGTQTITRLSNVEVLSSLDYVQIRDIEPVLTKISFMVTI